METVDYKIRRNIQVAPDVYRLELLAPDPGFRPEGEFVNLAIEGFYLRRPLSVLDCGPGWLTLIYKVAGDGTAALSRLGEGSELNILTGLGHGFDEFRCHRSALLAGGGLGAAPLYQLCRKLAGSGKNMTVLLCFNRACDIVLEKEFREFCPDTHIVTMDGSAGIKGFATDALDLLKPDFDFYYTCGPLPMMKALAQRLGPEGQVCLEERMGCGGGWCCGCTCRTTDGPRRVCSDGPVFDSGNIIW